MYAGEAYMAANSTYEEKLLKDLEKINEFVKRKDEEKKIAEEQLQICEDNQETES
jgi:hypothetical protein